MAPGRGDVIVAGGLILLTTMRRFDVDRVLVSETDILDGLALEMLAAPTRSTTAPTSTVAPDGDAHRVP